MRMPGRPGSERAAEGFGAQKESSPCMRRCGAALYQIGRLFRRFREPHRRLPIRVQPLRRRCVSLHHLSFALTLSSTKRASFVPEHARIATFMSADVDQLSLFTLVKGHVTTWTSRATRLALE